VFNKLRKTNHCLFQHYVPSHQQLFFLRQQHWSDLKLEHLNVGLPGFQGIRLSATKPANSTRSWKERKVWENFKCAAAHFVRSTDIASLLCTSKMPECIMCSFCAEKSFLHFWARIRCSTNDCKSLPRTFYARYRGRQWKYSSQSRNRRPRVKFDQIFRTADTSATSTIDESRKFSNKWKSFKGRW